MRTTVTLDPDTHELLKVVMRDRGLTFKEALNSAIRAGCTIPAQPATPFVSPTFHMGVPRVNLDTALQVAGSLEDWAVRPSR